MGLFVRRFGRNPCFGFEKAKLTIPMEPTFQSEDMRTSREVSNSTKAKISQGVKQSHLRKTETEKQQTRAKQSASMKRYWQTIPKKEEEDVPQVDTTYAW